MKTTKILMIVSLILASISAAFAQQDTNSFFDENGTIASNLPTSGPKEDLKPIEFLNPRADDIWWSQVVYRMIDLREKINFPLYFPEEAADGRQSLFTLLFNLLREGKINGYEYQDGKEVFSEDTKLKFDEELLQKMGVSLYSTEVDPVTNETVFKVDESDIPNREIMKYYVKEVWYFDKHSSIFNVKTLAICPILYTDDPDIGIKKIALFWIPFDLLRPHLSQTEVLLSDKNNGMRMSFDDLFIKRRYGSYVFKFGNVYNRNILQYCATVEEVKREQNALKTQLINFEEDLWEY
ncbi:gliding motility protein GldO [Bacteroidia bacterium]|nr:gliding motility protein GldO [Bacteroidia bacterium]